MSKKIPERLEDIDVVRYEDGKIHVLGKSDFKFFIDDCRYLSHTVHNAKTGEVIEQDYFKRGTYDGLFIGAVLIASGIFLPIGLPILIYNLRKSAKERREKTIQYGDLVKKFKEENVKELKEKVKNIRVYQGSISDLVQETGKELERVETGKPEAFIQDKDTFWLRVKAHCLGADAIVDYQSGSSIGTPVKYKE